MKLAKYHPYAIAHSPFAEMMNDLFARDIGHVVGHDDVKHRGPRVNIVENDKAFTIHLLAPGFTKEELKLKVENSQLTVSANAAEEKTSENERWTRREFKFNSFSRTFTLPENVNTEAISAEHANGVLTVIIPKVETAAPKSREINIH
ncbi:MAG TPA: Hsp20/alpha crystallin family protein [Flavobacteriales bacterium]|nr:Hsp20/alpha crystallin family protein [Flavobacteriales bacterium]